MIYQMTPIANGTRIRKDHSTFADVISSVGANIVVQGNEKWVAPADGLEVKKNDVWIKLTHVNGVLLSPSQVGWMAYIHKGYPICNNYKEIPESPPVGENEIAQSLTVTYHFESGDVSKNYNLGA